MRVAVIPFEQNLPHEVCEVICVFCHNRYIATFPGNVKLKDLECPKCNTKNGIIKTGQTINEVV